MIAGLIEWLGSLAHSLIDSLGYAGVFAGMAIESANIPLPSEAIMPFAGALAAEGRFNFWVVVFIGALGNLLGSVISYWLGARGGRPFVERYGRWFFISSADLKAADSWFARYGLWAAFLTRLLPIVRTFISFPAGLARVPFLPFAALTFAGSLLWSALLAYLGYTLGPDYATTIQPLLHKFDVVIGVALAAGLVWYVVRHRKRHG